MLPTIPFKRKPNKSSTSSSTTNHARPKAEHYVAQSKHIAHHKSSSFSSVLRPWYLVAIVLAVVVIGIFVVQFSRASTVDQSNIPENLADIQNYISSLVGGNSNAKIVSQSGYVEFTYTPKNQNLTSNVAYYIDGKLANITDTSPYSFVFDTQRYSNGSHTLTVVAFNASGIPVGAITKNLTFDNSNGLLPGLQKTLTYPYYQLLGI